MSVFAILLFLPFITTTLSADGPSGVQYVLEEKTGRFTLSVGRNRPVRILPNNLVAFTTDTRMAVIPGEPVEEGYVGYSRELDEAYAGILGIPKDFKDSAELRQRVRALPTFDVIDLVRKERVGRLVVKTLAVSRDRLVSLRCVSGGMMKAEFSGGRGTDASVDFTTGEAGEFLQKYRERIVSLETRIRSYVRKPMTGGGTAIDISTTSKPMVSPAGRTFGNKITGKPPEGNVTPRKPRNSGR